MKVKSLWMSIGIKLVQSPSQLLCHLVMQNMINCNKKSQPFANQLLIREAHGSLMKWRPGIHPVCTAFKSLCCQRANVRLTSSALIPDFEDQYPLPKAEDLFVTLSGGKLFSKLDLTSAYMTQELAKSSKKLTAGTNNYADALSRVKQSSRWNCMVKDKGNFRYQLSGGARSNASSAEEDPDEPLNVVAFETRVQAMHSQMLGAMARLPESLSQVVRHMAESAFRIADRSAHTTKPIIASVQTMVDSQSDHAVPDVMRHVMGNVTAAIAAQAEGNQRLSALLERMAAGLEAQNALMHSQQRPQSTLLLSCLVASRLGGQWKPAKRVSANFGDWPVLYGAVIRSQRFKGEKMNNSAMNNTASSPGTFTNNNSTSNVSLTCDSPGTAYNATLIVIYSIVLVGGSAGAFIMTWKIKTDRKSVTSTAVINLISVHIIFLLTVPFRISYYALGEWKFGAIFCKLVSAMIHAHMYLSFVFYVTIVVIRMISFFREKKTMQFYQPWHASVASLAIWGLVLLAVLPLFLGFYGTSKKYNKMQCFQFQAEITNRFVLVVNYFSVIVVSTTNCVLLAIQMCIIIRLAAKHASTFRKQQQFGAQTKTLLFLLVMITCFLPYLGFRLFYINQVVAHHCSLILHIINEIFLALTAMSCFDVLTFLVAAH
uniref:probable G-protein coupled receptor 141 n=1 Tax=Pristiophorus japonicus TaxID=55135 RepID=UPI00398E8FC0